MDRALFVVTQHSETEQDLLEEAATLSDAADASLSVLRLMTAREYASAESTEVTSDFDRVNYEDPATAQFEAETESFVESVLDSYDIEYELAIEIKSEGDRADAVIETAEQLGCDHVFLAGKRKSPAGKVIFGDLTQEIILNFDGTVTLAMD